MSTLGRPREWDESAVLDAAMDLFWTQGYARTSMRDVVDHTGVKLQSLYGAFGDKASLFERTLERYARGLEAIRTDLAASDSVLDALARVMTDAILVAVETPGRGCMLGNAVAELVPVDARITAAATRAYRDLEDILFVAIERGQRSGEIRRDADPRALALALLASLQGLRLISRAEPDPSRLIGAANVLVMNLKAPAG